jgi:hypothetical protein
MRRPSAPTRRRSNWPMSPSCDVFYLCRKEAEACVFGRKRIKATKRRCPLLADCRLEGMTPKGRAVGSILDSSKWLASLLLSGRPTSFLRRPVMRCCVTLGPLSDGQSVCDAFELLSYVRRKCR